jgi:hypothetical protein
MSGSNEAVSLTNAAETRTCFDELSAPWPTCEEFLPSGLSRRPGPEAVAVARCRTERWGESLSCWDSQLREGGGQGITPPPRLNRTPGYTKGWARCIPASTHGPCLDRVANAFVHRVWVSENRERFLDGLSRHEPGLDALSRSLALSDRLTPSQARPAR